MNHLILVLSSAFFPASAADAPRAFPAGALSALEVSTEAGDIAVRRGPDSEVSVAVTKDDPKECEVTMAEKDGALVLRAKSLARWPRKGSCKTGFEVRAPRALALKARSGSGNLAAAGLDGRLALESGSGDVSLDEAGGDLDVRLGSGDLSGTLRTPRAKVEAGSGDVTLEWTAAPEGGAVSVEAGSGDVTLRFPEKARLAPDLESGAGTVRDEFGGSQGLAVSVESGSGDVVLAKAKPARQAR